MSEQEADRELEFQDAQEMAKLHPDTFTAPDMKMLEASLRPGDFVKVCHMDERFWVRVIGLLYEEHGNKIAGLVANDLLADNDLKFDDPIMFGYQNVYELMDKKLADKEMTDTEVENVQLVHEHCRGKSRRDYH